MTKHNTIVLSIAAVLSVFIFFIPKKEKLPAITSRVISSGSGWGYEILVNDKLFIRQESIPVLNGDKGFTEPGQAQQTAQLIINKMKSGQPPTVTTFDLQRICHFNEPDHGQQGKHQ